MVKKKIIITIIIVCVLLFIFKVSTFCTGINNKKIYILSASISEDSYVLPAYNWGECIHDYIDTEQIDIVNVNIEPNFEIYDFISFDKQLRKNDYVLIQLGNIYAEPTRCDFDRIDKLYDVCNEWIKDIKDKNAIPIIFTPNYINNDKSSSLNEYYNVFSNIVVKCAEENNVPVVDLTQITYDAFNSIEKNFGEQYIKSLYVIDKDCENQINRFVLNYCGAVFVSGFVAERLSSIDSISKYVNQQIVVENLPKISRGEFIKQLLQIANIESGTTNYNKSISNINDYYMKIAIDIGIVSGSEDGNYCTDCEITIDEACAIADRLLQFKGIVRNKEDVNPFMLKLYGVDDYAVDSVSRFYSVAERGLNYDAYYLMSIYGIYDIVYNDLN